MSIVKNWVGKFVLVRSRNEGLNAGTVVAADSTGVVLENARRLWYHRPKDAKLSWYEGVAVSGLSKDSSVSCSVDKIICEDYSLTACTPEAQESILKAIPNAQD